jgi:bifunctional non-homologous end joining protein LigD
VKRPQTIAPMTATLADAVPTDDGWAFEVKWDGVRAVTFVEGGDVCVQSRNLLDVTSQYPELGGLAGALGGREAVLDGEIVAPDAQGRPVFSRLQQRMHQTSRTVVAAKRAEFPVLYIVFDLLYLDGRSTMAQPYHVRRRMLTALGLNGPAWQTPAHHVGHGAEVLAVTRAQGMEGVVAKRVDSTYEPGKRTRAWLKIKNKNRQEFVVAGWSAGAGNREGRIGSLLLGYYDDGRFRYAGNVGTGFTGRMLDDLAARLEPLRRDTSPFDDPPKIPGVVSYVEPRLVGEVEFTEWTTDGVLRHPSWKGLREDKDASAVVRERPMGE